MCIRDRNNYNKFLLNKEVKFEDIGKILRFGVEDYNTDGVPDIYCFKKENDDNLEVDILDGNDNYNKCFLEVPTIMNISNDNGEFLIGKGRLNIYCILSDNTLSNKIEVHKFGFKDDIAVSYTHLNSNCDGNGFKLGGSGVPTAHVVTNCIAIENLHHGFTDNNNPAALKITNCTAFENNLGGKKNNFSLYRCKDAVVSNCISYTDVYKRQVQQVFVLIL